MLVTVLPLASESRELTEPLMWEPLESKELPEGKGSLGAGERQRGMPPRLEHDPVGESRSLGGWGADPCSTRLPRSTSSPFTEPASEPCATDARSPGQEKQRIPLNLLTILQLLLLGHPHFFKIFNLLYKHYTKFLYINLSFLLTCRGQR